MSKNKYETLCDEILQNEVFENELALNYCERGFKDIELEKLSKTELINLLGKAFVVIYVLTKDYTDLLNNTNEKTDAYVEKTREQKYIIDTLIKELRTGLPKIKLKYKTQIPSAGGIAKAQKSTKTQEKNFVKECWVAWRSDLSKYKSKAAFALDMLEKCEHLQSSKVIEDWCRTWEKESSC